MRVFVAAGVLLLSSLSLFGCEDAEPYVRLEILSPAPGVTGAAISFRIERNGPIRVSNLYVAKASTPDTVLRQQACNANFGPTCEGTVELPAVIDDYEVWADLELNDDDQTTLITERFPVRIDGRLLVVSGMTRNDPKKLFLLVTGANELELSTLSTIKVEARFARLPYIDLPSFRGFGFGTAEISVTASYSGNFLVLEGDFQGPATYVVNLEGVTNKAGMHVKAPVEIEQSFFLPSIDLGRVFISGVGTPPHFVRADDGRLFSLVNGAVRVLDASTAQWTEVVRWTDGAAPYVDGAGTVYLHDSDDTGTRVRKWDGTAWIEFPRAAVQPGASFAASLATTSAGVLMLAASSVTLLSAVSDTNLYRWDGAQWQLVLTRTFSPHSGPVSLIRFRDTVAMTHDVQLEVLQGSTFTTLAGPEPVLSTLSTTFSYSLRDLRFDAAGTPHLLVNYFDASQPGNEVAIPASGTAVVRHDGTAWQLAASGNLLDQAWKKPFMVSSSLFIKDVQYRAWSFDAAGTPHLFTRETVNPSGDRDTARYNISGFTFRDGAWGPLASAPSPVLADELHRLPGPYPVMAPVVLYDAAFDTSGRLWTVNLVSDRLAVQRETYVLSYHP